MADVFSKETRSKIMSCIRGKDTKPEIMLRKELFKRGYRYSLKHKFKGLNFTPDMVMVSRKICVFVDGCFWHKCPECYKRPKSNKDYWERKIERNIQRDKEQNEFLKSKGWNVIRVWEHEILKTLDQTLRRIMDEIKKDS